MSSPLLKLQMVPILLVLGNGVVQATPSLTLTDILYVPRFSFSLLSISQFTKHNNYKIPLFSSHCVF